MVDRPKRRWVVILDGSSNRAAATKDILMSNAFRLIRGIDWAGAGGEPQIVLYFTGVGTRGDTLSAVTGRGFDDIIIEAYVALSSNYLPGDDVYVIGFSRGAAAAHALTWMMSEPGLLAPQWLERFPEIWQYFLSGKKRREALSDDLRRCLYPPAPVAFVGAFDAVAGSSWDVLKIFSKVRFENFSPAPCVRHAIHILSIDDNRSAFAPLLWRGSSEERQVIEQTWMPGVHADVGGTSKEGRLLGDISVLSMLNRLRRYCPELLLIDLYCREVKHSIGSAKEVVISNERGDVFRKILRRSLRETARGRGQSGEYVHPILHAMVGRRIVQRGRSAVYQPSISTAGLRTVDLGDDAAFLTNALERLLSQ